MAYCQESRECFAFERVVRWFFINPAVFQRTGVPGKKLVYRVAHDENQLDVFTKIIVETLGNLRRCLTADSHGNGWINFTYQLFIGSFVVISVDIPVVAFGIIKVRFFYRRQIDILMLREDVI